MYLADNRENMSELVSVSPPGVRWPAAQAGVKWVQNLRGNKRVSI